MNRLHAFDLQFDPHLLKSLKLSDKRDKQALPWIAARMPLFPNYTTQGQGEISNNDTTGLRVRQVEKRF